MTGKITCLAFMAGSLLAWIWLKAKKKEKNKQDAFKVLVLAGFFGLAICVSEDSSKRLTEDGKLMRNKAGEGSDVQQFELSADGMLKDYDYTLEVEEQRLEGRALSQMFSDAAKEAEQQFIAKNQSLDRIETNVALPKKLQNGQIRAQWQFEPEYVIDSEGELKSEEIDSNGELVMVSLTMAYFDEVETHMFGCQVYPKKKDGAEQLLADLADYFEQEQEQNKHKAYIRMPQQLNGIILHWSQKNAYTYHFILFIGLAAAAAVYIQQGLHVQKMEQQRKEKLLRQYPDMVSKLSLLLGAGMTLSGAWERIVLNYQRQKDMRQTDTLETYEEMLVSYREMQDGIGELTVYERFGERCGTPQHRKLSMLLVQNLRKGSDGLTQSLEKEVAEAFTLRKNHAKRAGEEAGTKILIPMLIMLCIVMVIILVPAFLTFQL